MKENNKTHRLVEFVQGTWNFLFVPRNISVKANVLNGALDGISYVSLFALGNGAPSDVKGLLVTGFLGGLIGSQIIRTQYLLKE